MSNLSFQDKLRLRNGIGVVLCRSKTDDGKPFFHYVKAERAAIEQMHRDYAAGTVVDFAGYGEIVYSGWGENPTPEDEEKVKKMFAGG